MYRSSWGKFFCYKPLILNMLCDSKIQQEVRLRVDIAILRGRNRKEEKIEGPKQIQNLKTQKEYSLVRCLPGPQRWGSHFLDMLRWDGPTFWTHCGPAPTALCCHTSMVALLCLVPTAALWSDPLCKGLCLGCVMMAILALSHGSSPNQSSLWWGPLVAEALELWTCDRRVSPHDLWHACRSFFHCLGK